MFIIEVLVLDVAVTHGHLDHVGAIDPLIKVYPDLKIIFHETEAPFLLGPAEPSCYDLSKPVPSGESISFKLLQFLRLLPPFVQYKVRPAGPTWVPSSIVCMLVNRLSQDSEQLGFIEVTLACCKA